MGDACWLNIRFARKDLDKFNEVLSNFIWQGTFWDEERGDEYEVIAEVKAANYGWHEYIYLLSKKKLSFIANHGPGESYGSYGPFTFACYKGDLVICPANMDGYPVAKVLWDGVDLIQENLGKELHRIKALVEEEIEEGRRKGGSNYESND